MKLDLKSFKKIEEADGYAVLQHDKGHELKIAFKGLSPDFKKELDELPIYKAKGGFSKHAQKFDPSIKGSVAHKEGARPILPGHMQNPAGKIVPSKASKPAASSDTMPGNPMEAKNNYTEPMQQGVAEPMDVVSAALNREAPPFGPKGAPKYHSPPCVNPSCKSYGHPHPNCRCYGGKMGMYGGYAEGGEVENFCSTKKPHEQGCEYFKEGGVATNDAPGVDPTIEENQPEPHPNPMPQPVPESTPDPVQQPGPTPQSEPSPQEWQGSQGVAPRDDSQDQQTPENMPAVQQQEPAPQNPVQHFEQKKANNLQEMSAETQAFQNDLNMGHITPETYSTLFAKKSTLGKIGTIFGLLIGGAGAGLAHQPNMLMEMMGKEIQNDLQAQEQSATNRQNFLRINQQNVLTQAQAKNLSVDAGLKSRALANINMNMAAFHKLATMANDPKLNPAQRAQAQQSLAMVYQAMNAENSNIMDKAAAGSALLGVMGAGSGGNGTPSTGPMKAGFFGPEGKVMGEDIESKTVPGLPGRAAYPLGTAEKGELQSGMVFDKSINDLIDWAKRHPNGALPKSPEDQRGRAIAGIVQGKFREATNGGVYKSGEQDFINKLIPEDPTKAFNAYRVLPKLQAVKQEMNNQLDQKAKNYGFHGYPQRGKDGKLYVRSSDGRHMVPVGK